MSVFLPGLVIGQPFVRKRGKAKASIADPNRLSVVGHNFGGNVHKRTLLNWYHFTSAFEPMDEHKLMNAVRCVVGFHHILPEQLLSR